MPRPKKSETAKAENEAASAALQSPVPSTPAPPAPSVADVVKGLDFRGIETLATGQIRGVVTEADLLAKQADSPAASPAPSFTFGSVPTPPGPAPVPNLNPTETSPVLTEILGALTGMKDSLSSLGAEVGKVADRVEMVEKAIGAVSREHGSVCRGIDSITQGLLEVKAAFLDRLEVLVTEVRKSNGTSSSPSPKAVKSSTPVPTEVVETTPEPEKVDLAGVVDQVPNLAQSFHAWISKVAQPIDGPGTLKNLVDQLSGQGVSGVTLEHLSAWFSREGYLRDGVLKAKD